MKKRKESKKEEATIESKEVLSKVKIIGYLQLLFGVFLTCLAVVGLNANMLTFRVDEMILVICFFAVGAFLLSRYFRTKRLLSTFHNYVKVLNGQSSVTFLDLSKIVGKPENQVIADVQAMMNRGYFETAYIDYKNQRIVLFLEESKEVAEDELQYAVVACSICGGDNRIAIGKPHNCMYCGNVINGQEASKQKKVGFLKKQVEKLLRRRKRL